jgi:hypothetical protein
MLRRTTGNFLDQYIAHQLFAIATRLKVWAEGETSSPRLTSNTAAAIEQQRENKLENVTEPDNHAAITAVGAPLVEEVSVISAPLRNAKVARVG